MKTLLFRAFKLCSSYTLFHSEVTFLKQFFNNNGFNPQLFDKITNRFLNNHFQPKPPIHTVKKQEIYVKIPYLGYLTKKIQSSLSKNLCKFYPQVDFKFIPTNDFRIASLFRFKDQLPTDLRSSIVYIFKCPSCQARYIGSTNRTFKVRVDEHIGQSSRTGLPCRTPSHSAVREHAEVCNSPVCKSSFEILATCNSLDIRILESLYIKSMNPELNNMLSASPLNIA